MTRQAARGLTQINRRLRALLLAVDGVAHVVAGLLEAAAGLLGGAFAVARGERGLT